ncbi:proteobacterial dedicated sortase system histidine kinase [Thalassotalea sp. Y01]|uniref:proteobacterial dedicated sortase system histidine kinase n=1 Tax=Thalassotalea sp. Y01 TaxID=2729613 RepID=UPI00145E73B2|nr:proteobacterial dedicated sortase system histidine kinase [Thalassotalea sp. Y01]
MRISITVKLMMVASVLLAIPFIGYYYIWDMEKYLRVGQEQTLKNNAKALATALHNRPNLFNPHASYKDTLEQGKDFFPTEINDAILLDGKDEDWQQYSATRNINRYDYQNQIGSKLTKQQVSVEYSANIGRYKGFVYAFFNVTDDKLILRPENAISISNNDHLEIATIDYLGQLQRYIISNHKAGWVSAFKVSDVPGATPQNEPGIQGHLAITENGYNIEIRLKEDMLGDKVGFQILDVDSLQKPIQHVAVGTANTHDAQDLGTFTVPSPEIEAIIAAMGRTHSAITVVDKHSRILKHQGSIYNATGDYLEPLDLQQNTYSAGFSGNWISQFKQWVLEPFYQYLLTRPPKEFQIQAFDNRRHQNRHVNNALLRGRLDSIWWTTPDNKAVILSAAHPIYVDDKVMGAVVVEETTHGIRNIRNAAVEGVLLTSLFIFISVLALFLYTVRLSYRIRQLRNQTDALIDDNGRLRGMMTAATAKDEIGDLSRSFTDIIQQLGQYNDYLQNMSSRLSHELKTPVAVVRSSLEHLALTETDANKSVFVQRAQQGINRLHSILLAMSEATRLEQTIEHSEFESFDLAALVKGCSNSYQQIYQPQSFHVRISEEPTLFIGSDEHIAQLFDKLIANAVEFSDGSAIDIQLQNDKQQVQLSVSNKGPLLPDNMMLSIFDAMVSIRTLQQSNAESEQLHLGIGLYICRLIAEQHKGKIIAENLIDDSGVRFTLTLPK